MHVFSCRARNVEIDMRKDEVSNNHVANNFCFHFLFIKERTPQVFKIESVYRANWPKVFWKTGAIANLNSLTLGIFDLVHTQRKAIMP